MSRESKSYKEAYLKNLQQEIANIQTNERGMMNFRQFGSTNPNAIADNRTGVEKMGDTQRIINEVKKGLLEIMEPDYVVVVINQLQQDTPKLEFVYAKMPYIQRKLREKYRKESLMPGLFNEELDRIIYKDVVGLIEKEVLPTQLDVGDGGGGGGGGDDGGGYDSGDGGADLGEGSEHEGSVDEGSFDEGSVDEGSVAEKAKAKHLKFLYDNIISNDTKIYNTFQKGKITEDDKEDIIGYKLNIENLTTKLRELIFEEKPKLGTKIDLTYFALNKSIEDNNEESKLENQQKYNELIEINGSYETMLDEMTKINDYIKNIDEHGDFVSGSVEVEEAKLGSNEEPGSVKVPEVEEAKLGSNEETGSDSDSESKSEIGNEEVEEVFSNEDLKKLGLNESDIKDIKSPKKQNIEIIFKPKFQTYTQLNRYAYGSGKEKFDKQSKENQLVILKRLKKQMEAENKGSENTLLSTIQDIATLEDELGIHKGAQEVQKEPPKEEVKQGEGLRIKKPVFNHDRFEILKGEIIAGNDSRTILKEFKQMLHDAVRKRLISNEELEEYLDEIDGN